MGFYVPCQYDYYTTTLSPPDNTVTATISQTAIDPYLTNQMAIPNLWVDVASRKTRRAAKSGSKRGKTSQPWKRDYAWSHMLITFWLYDQVIRLDAF